MKDIRRNKGGFTLLELLIVIVILGVLAGLALPVYTASIERSRRQEAVATLSAVKDSASRFFQFNNTYTNMTYAQMDYDPTVPPGNGQTVHYAYGAPAVAGGGLTYTVTATRLLGVDGGNGTDTVQINQAGAIVYA